MKNQVRIAILLASLFAGVAAFAGSGGVESGGCNYFPSICLSGTGGAVLPSSTSSTATIGSQTLPWLNMYLSGALKDGAGTSRLTFTSTTSGNTSVGSASDAASMYAHKFGNVNILTSGTDRYIAAFYRDNLNTEMLRITSNGSVMPITSDVSTLGNSGARFLSASVQNYIDTGSIIRMAITNSTGTTHRGNIADGAAAVAHKFGNNVSLTSGTDRYIAEFYSDAFSTARLRIASNGSILPAANNTADLGAAAAGAFKTLYTYSIQGATSTTSPLNLAPAMTDATSSSSVATLLIKPTVSHDANSLITDVQTSAGTSLFNVDVEGDGMFAGAISSVGLTSTGVIRANGSDGFFIGNTAALPTCDANYIRAWRADGTTGGAGNGARTRFCACTGDGAASPAYAWVNLYTGAVGTTTTCPAATGAGSNSTTFSGYYPGFTAPDNNIARYEAVRSGTSERINAIVVGAGGTGAGSLTFALVNGTGTTLTGCSTTIACTAALSTSSSATCTGTYATTDTPLFIKVSGTCTNYPSVNVTAQMVE